MRDIPFSESVAERALVLERTNGTTLSVTLQIGRPVAVPEFNIPYACPFRLVGLDKPEQFYAVGEDGVQALQLALTGLGVWLDLMGKVHGGRLVAFGGAGHGFKSLR